MVVIDGASTDGTRQWLVPREPCTAAWLLANRFDADAQAGG